jgi:hypothetical protein
MQYKSAVKLGVIRGDTNQGGGITSVADYRDYWQSTMESKKLLPLIPTTFRLVTGFSWLRLYSNLTPDLAYQKVECDRLL